jgi:IS605 OrfB family transposase
MEASAAGAEQPAFAVFSDGWKIDSPRFLRRAEKKLKRLQRELSRKAKGSKNRAKARIKVARQHAKVADRRRDFHHKASTQIIRDNQAVYVEDLAVSGLGRTRLAKSVHDAGWSAFVGMLEYKAALHGRTFAKVDRAFPSSQVCSACGFRDGPKPLPVREWTCGECGTVHDRDHNAARNVLLEGRRIVAAARAGVPVLPALHRRLASPPASTSRRTRRRSTYGRGRRSGRPAAGWARTSNATYVAGCWSASSRARRGLERARDCAAAKLIRAVASASATYTTASPFM